MSLRTFLRLAHAQALMLWRNVTFWLISIFIAVLSMLVFGWLFKPEARTFELAVVDLDRTEASGQLTDAFSGLDNIEFKEGDRDEELASLKDGDRGAVVIIPEGFAEGVARSDANIEVFYDNSNLIRIGYVTSTVEATVQAFNEQMGGSKPAVAISAAAIDTETVRYIDFLAPGMVGMTIMFTNLAVGFLLVNWREMGILRRLGVTPLRPGILIGSQAVSFAFVSIAQVALILGVGWMVFDVEVQGSYVWLALTIMIGVFAMLSIGYTVASFARTATAYNALNQLLAFPMLFLGRSYFPIDPSPALAPVVEFVPLTHLNDALREIINHDAALGDLWLSWVVLLAWAAGGYLLSMRVFRWH